MRAKTKKQNEGSMKTQTITPAIKWHGGKQKLAKWIIDQMPPRVANPNKPEGEGWCHYVEPFAGGLGVLLAMNPEGVSEVVNDLNAELVNFWMTLANPLSFDKFKRLVDCVPFSEPDYDRATKNFETLCSMWPDDRIPGGIEKTKRAAWFFIRCRQSMSGRMDCFSPITRNRCRTGMNEQASAWLNAVDGLPAVHQRLRRVLILNDDALKVIRKQDGQRTLFYLDPPYLCETRTADDVYEHEMTDLQHGDLLTVLGGIEGKFILSGYHSTLYDEAAAAYGWRSVEKDVDNKSASGKTKQRRVEVLWMNY